MRAMLLMRTRRFKRGPGTTRPTTLPGMWASSSHALHCQSCDVHTANWCLDILCVACVAVGRPAGTRDTGILSLLTLRNGRLKSRIVMWFSWCGLQGTAREVTASTAGNSMVSLMRVYGDEGVGLPGRWV